METLLSPREFIKRFHLPQLVRISTSQEPLESTQVQQAPSVHVQQVYQVDHGNRNNHLSLDSTSNHQLTGADGRRLEQRDPGWTYSSGHDRDDCHAEASGSKSLHFADLEQRQPQQPMSLHNFDSESGAGAPLPPIARMLPRVKLLHATSSCSAASLEPQTRVEFARRTRLLNDQTLLLRRATSNCRRDGATATGAQQDQQATSRVQNTKLPVARRNSLLSTRNTNGSNNIKLMPPSKRPTLSKIDLEQPFLIYKAHRKLEICAYAADSNNELNDKSGEPIYFPHNYQGESRPLVFLSTRNDFDKYLYCFKESERVTGSFPECPLKLCELSLSNSRLNFHFKRVSHAPTNARRSKISGALRKVATVAC